MTDELHVDSELVEYVLEEEHTGGETDHGVHSAFAGSHIDLVCNGSDVVAAVGWVLGVGDDRLAALVELGEGLAEFLHLGHSAAGAVSLDEDVVDPLVGGCCLEAAVEVEHADHRGCALIGDAVHRIAFLGLLSEGDRGHIDHEGAAVLDFGGGAGAESEACDHHHEHNCVEEADDHHCDDHCQHGFEELFHIVLSLFLSLSDGKNSNNSKIALNLQSFRTNCENKECHIQVCRRAVRGCVPAVPGGL